MFRKSVMLATIASLLGPNLMWSHQAEAASLTMYQVYTYVQREHVTNILPYVQYNNILEIEDEYGNTPLCYAMYNQDTIMVQKLVFLGANQNARCIRNLPVEVLRRYGMTSRGYGSATAYSRSRSVRSSAPPIFTRKNLFTLGVLGGLAGIALLAAGGHGGGGGGGGGAVVPGGGGNPPDTPVLDPTETIPAVQDEESCPSGMSLINGVCTRSVSIYADGTEPDGTKPIVDISQTQSPYYLAEFGGVISNDQELSYLGQEGERVIVMQANGVGKDALSADGTLVYLSKASMVRNTKKGTIKLTETKDTDGGVIGLYGTSAGTIKNEGNITITSRSHAESAGMKVDRDPSKPITIVGAGANVNNTGTITVVDQGDGMGVLSAISAPSRSVTNKGTIGISLDTSGGAINKDTKGTVHGIYGRNIVNDGTISLATNGLGANTPINTEAYLIRGYGDPGSTVANTGAMNIDLTNIAWNIYGLWSDEAATYGTSVKNKGTIDVTGALYNDTGADDTLLKAKHVFLVGSEGGVVDLDNSGTINVGTATAPIDISRGGIMNALYGYSGYVYNSGKLNFHLQADPTQSSKAFSALAMSLDRGVMVNDADITYSFSNKLPGITTTNQVIQLTAISSSSATITNNANITATLTGVAADKSATLGEDAGRSRFSAMRSIQSSMLNTGKIAVTSDMNNMDLVGMIAPNGDATNSDTGKIALTTSGKNSDLVGAIAPAGVNSGSVYLTHNGGSGDIVGFDGGNQGLIQINADDMTGESFITGGETWEAISETGESSNPDTTAEVRGMINITLTGKTSGDIYGYEYKGKAKNGKEDPMPPSYFSSNTINITAEDGYRVGNLNITGVLADTYGVASEGAGVVSLTRDGTMTLNVLASSNPNYYTGIVGLSAEDSNITNSENSVVNLNVDLNNSTNHLIVGMQSADTSIAVNPETELFETPYYNEFRATNAGTLNLNITGAGAVPDVEHKRSSIPFDIVGMLTNSYALNTGTINLNVSSMTAKTAGMVAYRGGLIVNAGTINFTGNAANFVPMYASGHRQIYEYNKEQTSATSSVETARQRDFWGTIYNFGRIIVTHDTTDLIPKGNGYFSTDPEAFTDDSGNFNLEGTAAEDVWAKRNEFVKITCEKGESGEQCAITEHKTTDTRDDFTKFGDPIPVDPIQITTTPSNPQSGSSAPDINPAESTDTTTTPTTPTIATSVAQTPSMLINSGMRYVSEKGASFEAEGVHLLGDVAAGKTLVQGTNANTYVASGEGSGVVVGDGDFSDLNLTSDSVMFKASYAQNATNANGADIVMQRKSFYEILGNTSLAGYLERNYMMGNNVAFFDQLKSFNKLNNLNNALDHFTGKNVLSRFNFEDLTMMRELNFDMNDKIFHNNEDVMQVAGSVKPLAFKGDIGSDAKYSLLYKNYGNYSVGVGMAFANIRSDDGHKDNKRQEMLYQMNVPIGTKILGVHVMTSPRLGYARGSYTRTGFDESNYKGTLEKRVFGLANEIRYPMVFGSWIVEPVSEFNILGYNQRGKEDNKAYSLQVKSQNTYSVEGGVGVYVTKTANLAKDSTLKLSSGVVMYHEFADPYKLDVGMTGMDGTFTLRDETHSQNRAVARFGFDYNRENLSLYGALTSFIDDEVRTNVKSGMNWKF